MKRYHRLLVLYVVCFCIIAFPGSVLSQETESETEGDELKLESLTVTANKREEDIRKIPASITAFSETEITDAGIEDMDQVIEYIPGMDMHQKTYGQNINFRGMSPSQFTTQNPVVFYVDGVAYDRPLDLAAIDLQNLERIEVLRGPQGTLYGKNAIGGVINIVTKKPGDEWEGIVTGETGQYGKAGLKASVSGPVIDDTFYFGFTGSMSKSDGYLENTDPDEEYVNDEALNTGKVFLRLTPMDKLEIDFIVDVIQMRQGGGTLIAGDEVTYKAYRNPDDKTETDTSSFALSVGYQLDAFDFQSVTTLKSTETYSVIDFAAFSDLMGIAVGDTEEDNLSQEFRIQSPEQSDGLKWLIGVALNSNVYNSKEQSWVYNTAASMGYDIKMFLEGPISEKTQSLFGEFSLPLGSLEITTGLRYEVIHKEMDIDYMLTRMDTGAVLPVDPFSGGVGSFSYTTEKDWTALLPKVVLAYNFGSKSMAYFSVSDGYLAGGFNYTEPVKENADFDAQKSRNYEIGTKLPFLNETVYLDAAIFYIDIRDMHVWESVGPSTYKASNAGKAHSQGFELQANAQATDTLLLNCALSKTEAKYDEYENKGVDYSGKTTQATPESKITLGAVYRNDLGIFAKASMVQVGKIYWDDANTVSQDPYTLVHTKLGYEAESWDVYLQVKNLLDTEYIEAYDTSNIGIRVGQPRTASLVASKRF